VLAYIKVGVGGKERKLNVYAHEVLAKEEEEEET